MFAEPHRTLLATPTALEVGVPNGTEGWVRIRAEVGDQGQVNASLAAGTSAGQEMLHRQLPALNAYLHSEQMAVTATVAERASTPSLGGLTNSSLNGGSSAAMADAGGLGSGLGGGLGGGPAGDGRQPGTSGAPANASDGRAGPDTAPIAGLDLGTGGSIAARTGVELDTGRWLNVRA